MSLNAVSPSNPISPSTGGMPAVEVPAAALLLGVTSALLVAGAATWAGLSWWNRPDAWTGFWPATFVSAAAALLSILPILLGGRFGMMGAVGGYFTASAVRVLVSIGGCLWFVYWRGAPLRSTLLIMCVYYAAVLAVETALLARKLWKATGHPAPSTSH